MLDMLTLLSSASYLAFSMIFLSQARTRLQQTEVSPTGQSPLTELDDGDAELKTRTAQKYLLDIIPLAHQSAQFLRDFRERYGLKITPAWLLQLQAVAAGVLVLDPDLDNSQIVTTPSATDLGSASPIDNSATAFDEVFRCLLGTGVEVMIARAIARMTYHTALKHEIFLSRSTMNMLKLMSETAWRPSDLRLVNSTFPNFATTKGHDDSEERMSEFLAKWEVLDI